MPECVKFIRKVWGWFVECDEDHRARRFISASLERVLFIFIKCWSCQLILLEECNPRPGILGKLFQSIWGEAGQNYCCHNSALAGHWTHGGRGFHKFWLIDTQPSVWNVKCLHRLVVSTRMEQGRTCASLSRVSGVFAWFLPNWTPSFVPDLDKRETLMHDGCELQPAYAYGGVFKNWILYFHTKINLHFIILQNIWPQYKLFNVYLWQGSENRNFATLKYSI